MDSGREHLIYGLLEELLKVNGGSRTEGEAQQQTSTMTKDVLTACMEQLKSSMSPDLTAGKNPKDGISDAWETSLTELGMAKGKDLDADKPKMQTDALVQNFAKLSIEVAKLKGAYSLLERDAVLRDAMAKQMLVENFLSEVASIMGEAKNPQTQLQTPTESFDQLNNAIRCQLSKIVSLNKAADNLKTVRTVLINKHEQLSVATALLHQELNTAVTEIRRSLDNVFERAEERIKAEDAIIQRKLRFLRFEGFGTQNILRTVQEALFTLDSKEADLKTTFELFKRLSNIQNKAHTVEEDLAHLKIKEYVVSPMGLTEIINALEIFDLVVQREDADQGDGRSL